MQKILQIKTLQETNHPAALLPRDVAWQIFSVLQKRGRNGALVCATPPSEPDLQISRIRLSSQQFASFEDGVTALGDVRLPPPRASLRGLPHSVSGSWNRLLASRFLAFAGNRYGII